MIPCGSPEDPLRTPWGSSEAPLRLPWVSPLVYKYALTAGWSLRGSSGDPLYSLVWHRHKDPRRRQEQLRHFARNPSLRSSRLPPHIVLYGQWVRSPRGHVKFCVDSAYKIEKNAFKSENIQAWTFFRTRLATIHRRLYNFSRNPVKKVNRKVRMGILRFYYAHVWLPTLVWLLRSREQQSCMCICWEEGIISCKKWPLPGLNKNKAASSYVAWYLRSSSTQLDVLLQ